LLPVVATEQGYTAEEFLRQVCRKAGLPTTAWEDDQTIVQTYEALEIPGKFAEEAIVANAGQAPILTTQELQTLAAHGGGNIAALAQGATPSYYVPGVSDGTANGVALTLKPENGNAIHFFRLSTRPGMPLQSTLFNLAETAANALRAGQLPIAGGNVTVALTLLTDPAMHGTVADPDLRGIDPARRALMVLEGQKSAWVYDPSKSPEELLAIAKDHAQVFQASHATLLSFAVQSTDSAIAVSNAPRAVTGPTTREPAVAGMFYPATASELDALVTECLGEECAKRKVPAVMIPHAGLMYSGRIAGKVLKQVEIPETVIIIGPKHTRLGVEWAIAPNETWKIPGAELAADVELAKELVAAIPGLQFDAAAHLREHAIEVELPFIARLAPKAKVVGIVIGTGDLERCRQFAAGLVKVLKAKERRPLLVISSDMNHYASDDENRRLDEIAMEALERLDPADVFETVTGRNISMCGVLPAVMVMEAVEQLGGLKRAERVAYATSADVSGDKSRVVGYCGMLFT
jgi:AmmeMemoRadiSam system protein B